MSSRVMDRHDISRQFAGGGALAEQILAMDWAASPLGPIEQWPRPLVDAVAMLLPAGVEIVLFWGPDYIALYNDAYAVLAADRHPRALGRP
ncbi:MAG: hybrid sensor histidine kinase/response regulator, partial [Sphingomonas bacterium]